MIRQPAILERVIEPQRGGLPVELARYILSLKFPSSDHTRYAELSGRAQEGRLTPEDEMELDDYLAVNALLMILQSKARVSLNNC